MVRITAFNTAGFVIGLILFLIFSFWVEGSLMILKPVICPTGEYETTADTYTQGGQTKGATAYWCRTASGELQGVGQYQVLFNCLSFLIPFGLAVVVGWLFKKITPKPAAPLTPNP